MVGDGWESKSNSSLSEVGNWCSLVFPETKPERIRTLTHLIDLGLIHDGISYVPAICLQLSDMGDRQYRSDVFFLLGRYFQIRDDYMNLVSKEYAAQKGTCEDLEEGKLSLPTVACIQDCPASKGKILGLFRQHAAGQRQQPIGMGDERKSLILQILND